MGRKQSLTPTLEFFAGAIKHKIFIITGSAQHQQLELSKRCHDKLVNFPATMHSGRSNSMNLRLSESLRPFQIVPETGFIYEMPGRGHHLVNRKNIRRVHRPDARSKVVYKIIISKISILSGFSWLEIFSHREHLRLTLTDFGKIHHV